MKVWITKWVLTNGIEVAENPEFSHNETVMEFKRGDHTIYLAGKRHWHATETDARRAASEIIAKRLTSLKRQVAKLEKMQLDYASGGDGQ